MVALAQAKTYHLTTIALSSAGLATFPVKLLCRHVQGLWHIGRREWSLSRSCHISITRRIYFAYLQTAETKRVCGLVKNWRNDRCNLVLTGSTLSTPMRRVAAY